MDKRAEAVGDTGKGVEHWIGVDGGATRFRAARVGLLDCGGLGLLCAPIVNSWPRDPRLDSVFSKGLGHGRDAVPSTPEELALENAWVQCLGGALGELLEDVPPGLVRLGLAMPGTKNSAGRGVIHMAHGPRLLSFSAKLEERLGLGSNLHLARLGSDGQDGGLGEEWARDGAFWGQPSALFIGLGTGLAEAAKIDGELLDPGALADLSAPPWKTPWPGTEGPSTVELCVSLGSIQRQLQEVRGPGLRPLDAARAGEPLALELLQFAGDTLGSWLGRRVEALNARAVHPIDRVVLGGAGATLLEEPAWGFFGASLRAALGPLKILPSRLTTAALFGAAARAQGLTGSRPA